MDEEKEDSTLADLRAKASVILAARYKFLYAFMNQYTDQEAVDVYWARKNLGYFDTLETSKEYINNLFNNPTWSPPPPKSGWKMSKAKLLVGLKVIQNAAEKLTGKTLFDMYFDNEQDVQALWAIFVEFKEIVDLPEDLEA
jgi:hypothetical protein